jgi:4-amino-4-deoxy-L-arabinose transferase-like glycosyltransferase
VWLSAPLAFWLASVQFGLLSAAAAALVMVLFPLMHAYIRPEPFVAAALALALLAYTLALRTRRWGWDGLVGFALMLTLEGNQMTVRFLPAFGLLYLWDAWRSRRERPRWWWEPRLAAFVGGLAVGAAAYYLFHVVYLAQTDLLGAVQMIQQRYVCRGGYRR